MTAYEMALRFVGEVRERPAEKDDPFIVWCLALVGFPDAHDEVPWCSAFANRIAWLLRLPRSKSAAARSWLAVGTPVTLHNAAVGSDVVILKRGTGDQPGPEVVAAPGHVGFFGGLEGGSVLVFGGNQGDAVTLAHFDVTRVLGVRRLVT